MCKHPAYVKIFHKKNFPNRRQLPACYPKPVHARIYFDVYFYGNTLMIQRFCIFKTDKSLQQIIFFQFGCPTHLGVPEYKYFPTNAALS